MKRAGSGSDAAKTFGAWLDRRITASGEELTVLAKKADVSAAYISMLRRGKRLPRPGVVHGLARALGATEELDEALAAAGFPTHAGGADEGRQNVPSSGSGQARLRRTRQVSVIDREWLIATMGDYATVCDCAILFEPADGSVSIVARPTLVDPEPGPVADWFRDCFTGWHASANALRVNTSGAQPRMVTCANGFTHVVTTVRLRGAVLGTLSIGALRGPNFDFRECLQLVRASGNTALEDEHRLRSHVEAHCRKLDDHALSTMPTLLRLLAQAIERAAAARDHDLRADEERAAVEEIAASLTSKLSVDEVLCRILDGVAQLIPFSYGNVTEVDWKGRKIRVLASKVPNQPAIAGRSRFSGEEWPIEEGITGWVAMRGRSRRLDDVRQDPRFIRNWKPSQSELAVPLILDGRVMGVLNLESETLAHFTEHDERLLSMVASHVATGVGRASMEKEQREWRDRFAGLAGLHRGVLQCADEASLLDELARRILALDGFEMCVIRTNDSENRQLLLGGFAHNQRALQSQEFGLKLPYRSLSGRVVQTNRTTVTPDVQREERFRRTDLVKELGLHGMVAVPIPAFDSRMPPVGCINVYTTRTGEWFTDDQIHLLEDIGGFVAVAHSNLRKTLLLKTWQDAITLCRDHRGAETLDDMCRSIRDHLGARCVSLFGLEDEALRLKGTTGIYGVDTPADCAAVAIPLGVGKTGWVAQHGKSIRLAERTDDNELQFYPDVHESHLWVEREEPPRADDEASYSAEDRRRIDAAKRRPFLAVPIRSDRGQVIGVIRAVCTRRELAFTPLDQEVLETFALTIGEPLHARLAGQIV